ncbi:hypothetical protein A6A06_04115 [Streptomyces sp. CB02923]|uniref:hypothetical protein n=1 Tax=Streptomyces sp. CB02923 TaxID=1718985 RepID=UPI00093D231A|nr:hypothetical protein [Streptomyces sp. CB02923]OKI09829.1 hypothetical protein A6A06_04115 [Streptomyces sp. CB02923]
MFPTAPSTAATAAPAADPASRGSAARAARNLLRRAGPALLGYTAVRLLGILVLMKWAHLQHHGVWPLLANQWDSRWYLGIADHGYAYAFDEHGLNESNLAFFPLYPVLVKAVAWVTPGSRASVGLVVAGGCALLAAWGIFAVGERLHGARTGTVLAVLWGATPVAAVQWMGYTESLFTALVAWSLYAVLSGRWVSAGALCLLAGLTRPTGLALVAAVCGSAAVALWRLRRAAVPAPAPLPAPAYAPDPAPGTAPELPPASHANPGPDPHANPDPDRARVRRIVLGALLAPLGWLAYVGWVGLRLGRADGYFAVQRQWTNQWDGGKETFRALRGLFVYLSNPPLFMVVVALVLIASVALFVLGVCDRQPLPLLIFSGVLLLIVLGSGGVFFPRARFLLPGFPLLLPLALAVARAHRRVAVLSLSAAALGSAYFGAYMTLVYGGPP